MARKRSMEREIAKQVVDTMLNNGRKGRKGNNPQGFILLIIIALASAFSWSSCVETEDDGVSPDQEASSSDSLLSDDPYYADEDMDGDSSQTTSSRYSIPESERVTVERCVDGDTLIVITSSGARERIRLIGANTPETVKPNSPVEPWGPEASAYTKKRVEENDNVATLVSDGSTYDRYNRRLAFVYLGDEEISLNEDLVRHGYAKAETQYSFSKEMKERLTSAAEKAKREKRGIYSLQ